MSTNSTIAVEYSDGSVRQVYCHWDGSLQHNGVTLLTHYSDPAKVMRLIEHGSISVLGSEIDPVGTHSFNHPEADVCVFYFRDRGEFRKVNTYRNFQEYADMHVYTGFDYVMRDITGSPTWYVTTDDTSEFVELRGLLSDTVSDTEV